MAKKKDKGSMHDLISQTEAAQMRGVTVSAIGDLIKRGRLSVVEIGGLRLLRRSEVENFQSSKGWPKGRSRKVASDD